MNLFGLDSIVCEPYMCMYKLNCIINVMVVFVLFLYHIPKCV